MKIGSFFVVFALLLAGCGKDPVINPDNGSFEDQRDKHVYKWIRIGEQVWTAENMGHLPAVSPVSDVSETEPYYYVYGYEGTSLSEARSISNYTKYGVLYNWKAAQTACPSGWHLPGDEEWKQLEQYLGMDQLQANSEGFRESGSIGKKLKSTSGWDNNGIGDNSSGFTALPGGYRSYNGNYEGAGLGAGFWSATENNVLTAWYRGLVFYNATLQRYYYAKSDGFSVRCLLDEDL